MGGIEALFVVLAILFYVVRALFRGIRGATQAVRRRAKPGPAEQVGRPQPSPWGPPELPRTPTRPRPEPGGRRPEAGGPAVTDTATAAQFRAQVAEIEAANDAADDLRQRQPLVPEEARPAEPTPPRLLGGPDDLLRAVIWQEVLAQPLSQRLRAPRPEPPQQ